MATTTTTDTTPAEATEAPAKRTRKAPAKRAEATPAATETAKKLLYTYSATGRAGVTNKRTFDREMAVAADVKDESHTSPRWKQGVITRFFSSREAYEKYALKLRADGCDVQIVTATLVETKTEA
jgi:hypothetical protein